MEAKYFPGPKKYYMMHGSSQERMVLFCQEGRYHFKEKGYIYDIKSLIEIGFTKIL